MRGSGLTTDEYLGRLRRIEGQVRGLQRMIQQGASCIDLLTQTSAVTHALRCVGLGLLDEHVRHCVSAAAKDEGEAEIMISEATRAIERLLRA